MLSKCAFCKEPGHSVRDRCGNIICSSLLNNTCMACGKRGHTSKNCNQPVCEVCGEVGHTTRQHRVQLQLESKPTVSKPSARMNNRFHLLDESDADDSRSNSVANRVKIDNRSPNEFPSLGDSSTSISPTGMNFANAATKPKPVACAKPTSAPMLVLSGKK